MQRHPYRYKQSLPGNLWIQESNTEKWDRAKDTEAITQKTSFSTSVYSHSSYLTFSFDFLILYLLNTHYNYTDLMKLIVLVYLPYYGMQIYFGKLEK